MLRKFIVMFAASLLWGAAAHAELKKGEPGYYAEHSTAYNEYEKRCNVQLTGDAAKKDEYAHDLEKMKVVKPELYAYKVCLTDTRPSQEERVARQDEADAAHAEAPPAKVEQVSARSHGGCPRGTTAAGKLGCVGGVITDRATLKAFDSSIKIGCRPGATRVLWRTGVDPQGRHYRLKLVQHQACRAR